MNLDTANYLSEDRLVAGVFYEGRLSDGSALEAAWLGEEKNCFVGFVHRWDGVVQIQLSHPDKFDYMHLVFYPIGEA